MGCITSFPFRRNKIKHPQDKTPGGANGRQGTSRTGRGVHIGRAMTESLGARKNEYKAIFLGTGETGKTTLFKRVVLECGAGYDEGHRLSYVESIHENVIESMKILVNWARDDGKIAIDSANDYHADLISHTDIDAPFTADVAVAIASLWQDRAILKAWDERRLYQICDTADYFFARMEQISALDYIPSEEDVLRCRDRTTGIHTERMNVVGREFLCVDVGGQKSERTRWEQVFRNVATIIYMVSLSEYDQLMFENEATNRLDDALATWEAMINHRRFELDGRPIPLILIFNKTDIFRRKLELGLSKFDLNGYDGPQTYDDCTAHFLKVFTSKNRQKLPLRAFFMCALSDDVQGVFRSVGEYYESGWEEDIENVTTGGEVSRPGV